MTTNKYEILNSLRYYPCINCTDNRHEITHHEAKDLMFSETQADWFCIDCFCDCCEDELPADGFSRLPSLQDLIDDQ